MSTPTALHQTSLPTRGRFYVDAFGMTDRGKVRAANEDSFLVAELRRTLEVHATSLPQADIQFSRHRGHVFIVADGIGGNQAGDRASVLTVVTLEGFLLNTLRRFFRLEVPEEQHVMKEFQNALREADARIFEEAAGHPDLLGMGTTLTMAFAVNWKLYLAHAGDCRCYLLSGNHLQQLTQDHTMAAEMVRRGLLSPDEARHSPVRNVVTNALGGSTPGVHVELHSLELEPDDVVLVCSDGLNAMVPDERIAAIVGKGKEPRAACEQLVAEANQRGGKDNITVIVARFADSPRR